MTLRRCSKTHRAFHADSALPVGLRLSVAPFA